MNRESPERSGPLVFGRRPWKSVKMEPLKLSDRKEFTYKWTRTVQTHAGQGSTVYTTTYLL